MSAENCYNRMFYFSTGTVPIVWRSAFLRSCARVPKTPEERGNMGAREHETRQEHTPFSDLQSERLNIASQELIQLCISSRLLNNNSVCAVHIAKDRS